MPRTRSIVLMTPAQQATVDNLLRRFDYGCLDHIKRTLAEQGITISRSALHRHAQHLRARDETAVSGGGSTLALVTDLQTGVATVLRLAAPVPLVLSAIASLSPTQGPDDEAANDAHTGFEMAQTIFTDHPT